MKCARSRCTDEPRHNQAYCSTHCEYLAQPRGSEAAYQDAYEREKKIDDRLDEIRTNERDQP